jgi:hypothetical protein
MKKVLRKKILYFENYILSSIALDLTLKYMLKKKYFKNLTCRIKINIYKFTLHVISCLSLMVANIMIIGGLHGH